MYTHIEKLTAVFKKELNNNKISPLRKIYLVEKIKLLNEFLIKRRT